jgi:4-methyl-5(b-hydroxyethyl)-thiazole monophosphate biosynthesis
MHDDGVKILLFLAQGFEDLEAVAILDVFGWTHYREHLRKADVTTVGLHEVVKSRFGLAIKPDLRLSEVNLEDYHAFALPGGFHSHGYEEVYDPAIHRIARGIHQRGGYIATGCVGVLPVADAGLLKGKQATTYPYSRHHDNLGRLRAGGARVVASDVVIDDRIISCAGPGSSLEVAFLLMECLMGPQTAREVRHYMIYKPD